MADVSITVASGELVLAGEDVGLSFGSSISVDEGSVSIAVGVPILDLSDWFFGSPAALYNIYTPAGGAVKFKMFFHGYKLTARDVTSGTFRMDIKRRRTDTTNLLTITSGDGISVYPRSNNSVDVVISSSQTQSIAGPNVYDLYYTINGNVELLMSGDFYVAKSVASLTLT